MKLLRWLLFFCSTPLFAAYDVNGVVLGSSEKDIRSHFPTILCKALEWQSRAAERRCDDARISFGGMEARITFYLKKDQVEAFDLRFDAREVERLLGHLRERYGKPTSEVKETIADRDKGPRQVVKVLWEGKAERAVLTATLNQRRGSLLVSRGNFEEEIYKVR